MADNDIIIATRYTTEGYDAAISKAERVGRTFRDLSSGLTRLGALMNSELLRSVGNTITGFQELADTVSNTYKIIKDVPVVGKLLAGAGGAFIGSSIYDATIGKLQGTNTETILRQIGELIRVGFNPETLRVEAQIAQVNAMTVENSKYKYDPNNIGDINERLKGTGVSVTGGDVNTLRKAVEETQKLLDIRIKEGDQVGSTVGQVATALKILQQALKDAEAANKDAATARLNQIFDPIKSKIKAAADIQDRLSSASKTYHAAQMDRAKELAEINAEVYQRRIAAAQSLTADLAKLDSAYYENRLRMAESFGLESQRAEEDHQREMRRLSQDHNRRMSRLADSRDALGLEDEIQNYEDQRKAAEEDYAVMQARRNQDYAIQLRDMEKAFQQQRQERINQYNEQLRDISKYLIEQRKLVNQQFADIAKAVMEAFTNAARAYTSVTNNQTTSTNSTLNQTNNFGSVSDPNAVANLVNSQVKAIFDAATK
jgi:hypothetical protein